jgi:hypothetical protein
LVEDLVPVVALVLGNLLFTKSAFSLLQLHDINSPVREIFSETRDRDKTYRRRDKG